MLLSTMQWPVALQTESHSWLQLATRIPMPVAFRHLARPQQSQLALLGRVTILLTSRTVVLV